MGCQWHQLDHMQIICTSLQTDNLASTSSLSFFTARMLFLTPNQQRQSTESNYINTVELLMAMQYIDTVQLLISLLSYNVYIKFDFLWRNWKAVSGRRGMIHVCRLWLCFVLLPVYNDTCHRCTMTWWWPDDNNNTKIYDAHMLSSIKLE